MLVSVIIPTHNRAALLLQTVEAVCRQSHRPLQIIVVDDGSTDGTWERLCVWAASWNSFSGLTFCPLRQAQAGASAARNYGLSAAQGDFIQFLDSDDSLSPEKVGQQAGFLATQSELDGAYCAWRSWFDGSLIRYGPRRQTTAIAEQEMLLGYLAGRWFLPAHAYLFRRRLLERIGPWDSRLAYEEDAEYLLRILAAGTRFGFVPGCWVDYRRHGAAQVSRLSAYDAAQRHLPRIAFRERICDHLSAAQRPAARAAIAALAARLQTGSAASARRVLADFGRTPLGQVIRRRFGDGLLAWLAYGTGTR
jgi:glycosyltransferase involved in cell wall biosynthesis